MSKRILLSVLFVCSIWAGCRNETAPGSTDQPTITAVTPGQINPGQQDVEGRIHGTNLNGVTSVSLGNDVTIQDYSSISSSEIYIFVSVPRSAAPGSRNVVVTTNTGVASSDSVFSVGDNSLPEAKFTVSPNSGLKDENFRFDGSKSNDLDGGIVSYHWKFGDGRSDTGRIATHSYRNGGNFDVVLTVTDNRGATAQHSRVLEVLASKPPVAQFSVTPSSGNVSTNFEFDGTSSRDPDGVIAKYLWNFGDGSTANGPVVSHNYTFNSTFLVVLTVADNTGVRDFSVRNLSISGGGGPPPPPPPGGGTQCTQQSKRGPQLYGRVISTNAAAGTAVVQFFTSVSCQNAAYKCGDLRLGGDPNPPEIWLGEICSMRDLGNNQMELTLRGGTRFPQVGDNNVYMWWQKCDGQFC